MTDAEITLEPDAVIAKAVALADSLGGEDEDTIMRLVDALSRSTLPREGQGDADMRDGAPCGWPDCGCCYDAKCSDAPSPAVRDGVVEALADHLDREAAFFESENGADPEADAGTANLLRRAAAALRALSTQEQGNG